MAAAAENLLSVEQHVSQLQEVPFDLCMSLAACSPTGVILQPLLLYPILTPLIYLLVLILFQRNDLHFIL